MDKSSIIGLIVGMVRADKEVEKNKKSKACEYSESEMRKVIQALQDTKKEWEAAGVCFEYANDSRLIDYAIYREEAAKARYMYLLSEAKKMGIKAGVENSFEKVIEA